MVISCVCCVDGSVEEVEGGGDGADCVGVEGGWGGRVGEGGGEGRGEGGGEGRGREETGITSSAGGREGERAAVSPSGRAGVAGARASWRRAHHASRRLVSRARCAGPRRRGRRGG